jgi:hypothetical protein
MVCQRILGILKEIPFHIFDLIILHKCYKKINLNFILLSNNFMYLIFFSIFFFQLKKFTHLKNK